MTLIIFPLMAKIILIILTILTILTTKGIGAIAR